jgi:hypothetical protein
MDDLDARTSLEYLRFVKQVNRLAGARIDGCSRFRSRKRDAIRKQHWLEVCKLSENSNAKLAEQAARCVTNPIASVLTVKELPAQD